MKITFLYATFRLDLPHVDPEVSERLAAAKLRGARSACFACKNIHLIKILARKLISLIYADVSCLPKGWTIYPGRGGGCQIQKKIHARN